MSLDPYICFERDIIEVESNDTPDMLLSHCCEGQVLGKILSDKKIKTKYCNVFKENLVYFFYGKPSYITEISPAFFIFKKVKNLSKKIRVAPMDTGGIKRGKYDSKKNKINFKTLNLDGFCLEREDDDSAFSASKKIINKFFKKNKLYFKGAFHSDYLNGSEGYNDLSYFSQIYSRICGDQIHGFNKKKKDPRKTTIEIQYKSDIDFSDFELISIICYEQFLSPDLNKHLTSIGYSDNIVSGFTIDILDSEEVREKAFRKMKEIQFNNIIREN